MIAERYYKNEDGIKALIVAGHERGVCDSDGNSMKVTNAAGQKVYVAKPKRHSSVTKTYVYREGRMVLKNG